MKLRGELFIGVALFDDYHPFKPRLRDRPRRVTGHHVQQYISASGELGSR